MDKRIALAEYQEYCEEDDFMRILIDMVHPADVNFYKNSIKELLKKDNEIIVTYIMRGSLGNIINQEYKNFNVKIICIGKHYKQKITKGLGVFDRVFKLLKFMVGKKIDITTGFASFYIAIASRIMRINSVIFYDDYEYKQVYGLCKVFATKFIIPFSIKDRGKNVHRAYDYKELAYLGNRYFTPEKTSLKKYGLIPKKYVFVREVVNYSLNYTHLKSNLSNILRAIEQMKLPVVLSLEDKSLIKDYNNKCIILEEPVVDIYSLIYFSKFVISSGDSVAREAALLGVPTLYTGKRDMAINNNLIKEGLLVASEKLSDIHMIKKKVNKHNYIDTTQVIVKNLIQSSEE
jgi:predicted glycosyltransferase